MPESVLTNSDAAATVCETDRMSRDQSVGVFNTLYAFVEKFLVRLLNGRGFWALADQAVLSLGNFFTSIVLFNFLPTANDIAIYGLILITILFLNGLHVSLVAYMLTVKGAPADDLTLRRLTGGALGLTAVLLVPLSIFLSIAVWKLGRPELIPLSVLALILWQAQETFRRALMAKLRYRHAIWGDAVSFLGQAGCVALLAYRGSLNLHTAIMSVAVTSGIAAVMQGLQLGVLTMPMPAMIELARESWRLGRWLLIAAFLTILTSQAMPWMLWRTHGDVEVSHFQALATLLGISNPVVTSVIALIVPAVAMQRTDERDFFQLARRETVKYGLLGAGLLFPAFLLIMCFPQVALSLFSHGKHESFAGLSFALRLFVLYYVLIYPAQVMTAMLNGLGHSHSTLIAQAGFAGATLLVSLPLAAKFGLNGAVWGGLIPPIVYSIISFQLLARIARKPVEPECHGFPVVVPASETEVAA